MTKTKRSWLDEIGDRASRISLLRWKLKRATDSTIIAQLIEDLGVCEAAQRHAFRTFAGEP